MQRSWSSWIRGLDPVSVVAAAPKGLFDRLEEIGRPLLYGTTTRFLETFGLASLKDLPPLDRENPNLVPPLKVADSTLADDEGDDSSEV